MSNQQPAQIHRSLTGYVTKLVGDGLVYGFINDEIFFSQANVSGGPAAVGDQVHAECDYSAHLPIKWNATTIKVISKTPNQHLPQTDSSSQPQQQQDLNQQQTPFNQPPVAVTYQQHRQQRQQRQLLDINTPTDNSKAQQNEGNEQFFAQNSRPFPQQPLQQQQAQPTTDSNIQPFQDQPMGPPNFTYTSQLGSAFVQPNQFVPVPFMTQPPPSMLPQQQHLLPQSNAQLHNQNNPRSGPHNKSGSTSGGGRFSNNDSKNDNRQNNRRNLNRSEDRPRSGDRDNAHNNRTTKSIDNARDKSSSRNNKREEVPARPSPPPHSSGRSTTSSDRGTRSRRHYEVQNIPKVQIMTNMNAYNMKQRCSTSIHVPSDLKDIIVNKHFRLDIKNTPKPLKYDIEIRKETPNRTGSEIQETVKDIEPATKEADTTKPTIEEGSIDVTQEVKKVDNLKSKEDPTPPSSKSDIKLNHKYGVKVLLLSLPEFEEIYRTVFGADLDSYTSESKAHSKLDEAISLLCNRGSNNGYSLIGGRFDPVLDGFIEGATNEFERHGRQPDLIATCKRVVAEQTGLDLAGCRSWNLLSTFIYNNRSEYFSSKASIEYSFIYMPELWTLLNNNLGEFIKEKEDVKTCSAPDTKELHPTVVEEKISQTTTESDVNQIVTENAQLQEGISIVKEEQDKAEITEPPVSTSQTSFEHLADLKVTDLKAELDRRDIKYKGNAKKADLIALLQDSLQRIMVDQNKNQDTTEQNDEKNKTIENDEQTKKEQIKEEEPQLEEGEVAEADVSDDSPPMDTEMKSQIPDPAPTKRKVDGLEVDNRENKKVCKEGVEKEERVELIREPFKVRARGDQQLSLVLLSDAAQASRYDQFELSVASTILKESLVQHLSEYILTVLIEDSRQKATVGSSPSSSSQETNSDTNNNNNSKVAFKNPSEHKLNLKELPVDRYINLAFSYFDSHHMGYVYFEDLNKLFNNTGLTLSKRALLSLVEDGERCNYRTLPDLSPKLPPTYNYRFPEQFTRLPGTASSDSIGKTSSRTLEYQGVVYDVEKLVEQVRDAETLRISLVDRFNYAIENSDKQLEEIHVLEVNQKSLAKAIKTQNDEICELKRERDSIKKKCENLRKGIKGTVTSLSDLIREEK